MVIEDKIVVEFLFCIMYELRDVKEFTLKDLLDVLELSLEISNPGDVIRKKYWSRSQTEYCFESLHLALIVFGKEDKWQVNGTMTPSIKNIFYRHDKDMQDMATQIAKAVEERYL